MSAFLLRRFDFRFILAVVTLLGSPVFAAERAVVLPPPAIDEPIEANAETAVFAGGCFWGIQGVFQHVKGVKSAVSGYAGGTSNTAIYQTVSTGTTGHAESVKVIFDPSEVSYGTLLQIFFSVAHNPTELNHQGPDTGTQYRSALFVASPQQRRIAENYIAQLGRAAIFPDPIVTEVDNLEGFYPAERYHQDYLALNPTNPYIVINDLPKIENLRSVFPRNFRSRPVLVLKAKG
ncbi:MULTISPECIES: peptide-methionine (S)-S-oxide reductase MsrA [Rhizobium]|uniref:Peptide methionine sulfoxide reductase MsrA n=1 Tax=Rhizobium favelukesii TaxID=348824 RepID=W6RMY0_9HYPH|nr:MULTISPECIES: peptide-methionine (S)-S-oxide reductase MsrA [Rhizobium]MCA0804755.1 peptide-methionine (S)-S-oxide reductase MsrA [Rhizobium sp. T1473]MCS0458029.1 peptide-methionine (S)-S-oxide reductase MsrA [Rhizobium favelukesii]UFS79865.1 peptide-methionine (S)-S-oxide reductase MsrA [Rhizobium sp. T136]CDM61575.1 Peptide methionine sulfoxide reductase MsrA 2 [Rhizobium favelukesii]